MDIEKDSPKSSYLCCIKNFFFKCGILVVFHFNLENFIKFYDNYGKKNLRGKNNQV